MDEITMFAAARPAPPDAEAADAALAAARSRLTASLRAQDARAGTRRRLKAAGVLASATALAAVSAAVLLTRGASTPDPYGKDKASIVTAAWTVTRDANGLVTMTLSNAFDDPAGLERALQSEGVTMIIKLNTVKNFGTGNTVELGYACAYTNLRTEPQSLLDAVASPAPVLPGDDQDAWIISPGAMPAGSALFLQGARLPGTPDSHGLIFNALVLLTSDDPGPCVPQTKPAPGYPGVWPHSAPPSPPASS